MSMNRILQLIEECKDYNALEHATFVPISAKGNEQHLNHSCTYLLIPVFSLERINIDRLIEEIKKLSISIESNIQSM
jgi:hypothetical protein